MKSYLAKNGNEAVVTYLSLSQCIFKCNLANSFSNLLQLTHDNEKAILKTLISLLLTNDSQIMKHELICSQDKISLSK